MGLIGSTGVYFANARQVLKAIPGSCSPVGRKPLATTIRSNRSWLSMASRSPMRDPPVLADQRDPAEVDADHPRSGPVHMRSIGVVGGSDGFVGLPETDEIGCQHTHSRVSEDGDHVAIQVAPSGFAVQHQYRRPVGGSLVDIVHPEVGPDLGVLFGEGIVGQADEAVWWRSQATAVPLRW